MLPFENLSEEKSNAFFADGVQDEILTDLARCRGPKGNQSHQRNAIQGDRCPRICERLRKRSVSLTCSKEVFSESPTRFE